MLILFVITFKIYKWRYIVIEITITNSVEKISSDELITINGGNVVSDSIGATMGYVGIAWAVPAGITCPPVGIAIGLIGAGVFGKCTHMY
ncbi:MAG: hypothetical protein SPL99_10430 [Catonella sp.]|nr:hypothetical protein [Catonella sp.]